MEDVVLQVIDRMHAAKRPDLLLLLAHSITLMTISGRVHYDDEDSQFHLRRVNEAIHKLAGHLGDLCDPHQAFTESRAAAVGEILAILPPSELARIYGRAV